MDPSPASDPAASGPWSSGPVSLRFAKAVTADPTGQIAPFHHFKILNPKGVVVGHINFRIGNSRHVLQCAGHVGYEIKRKHRGSSFAYHACLALAPYMRRFYTSVIITANPDNAPSLRIIEKLGARFLDQVDIPRDDPAYKCGVRQKRRYRWKL